MSLRLRVLSYLIGNWPALLWTLIGGLGLHWCWKLCRRWVPAYRHYKATGASTRKIAYARSRMLKSIDVTIILVTAVTVGTVVLSSPATQGGDRTYRYYVIILGLLAILSLITHVVYLMNREDEVGGRLEG